MRTTRRLMDVLAFPRAPGKSLAFGHESTLSFATRHPLHLAHHASFPRGGWALGRDSPHTPGDRRWFLGKFTGLLLLPELVGFPAAGVDPGADDHGKGIVVAGAFRWRDLTGESYLGMRRQG